MYAKLQGEHFCDTSCKTALQNSIAKQLCDTSCNKIATVVPLKFITWGRYLKVAHSYAHLKFEPKGEDMKKLLFACVIVACVLLTGCATIFDDDTSSVVINSDPTGAVIKVD